MEQEEVELPPLPDDDDAELIDPEVGLVLGDGDVELVDEIELAPEVVRKKRDRSEEKAMTTTPKLIKRESVKRKAIISLQSNPKRPVIEIPARVTRGSRSTLPLFKPDPLDKKKEKPSK